MVLLLTCFQQATPFEPFISPTNYNVLFNVVVRTKGSNPPLTFQLDLCGSSQSVTVRDQTQFSSRNFLCTVQVGFAIGTPIKT